MRPMRRTSSFLHFSCRRLYPATMEHREKITAPPTKLIVLLAFDRGEDGELMPAFEAREMQDEATAVRTAKEMARRHVEVITWSRTADLVNGVHQRQ